MRLGRGSERFRFDETFVIARVLDSPILERDNVPRARRTELDVVRDEDDGASLHEVALEAFEEEVVRGVRVDGGENVVE